MKGVFSKLVALSSLVVSGSALAQEAASSGPSVGMGLLGVGVGLAIGLGTLGAASGQGKAAASALEGIARNPTSRGDVFVPFILGLVFMEFQAFLAFAIAFLLMGKF